MTEEEKPKVEKKEAKLKYSVGEVITQTTPAVLYEENAMTLEETLVMILNKLDKIEKSVA